ncbi:MAG: SpoIIE family protein phosphatase [Ignavibacteria bacterium]|nr:SpoIIE family protein phosphatase [Ignavibacteria bacterium]
MLGLRSIRCLRTGLQALERYPLCISHLSSVLVFSLVLSALVSSFADVASAQNLLFEHLSYEQGLSESNVTAILQDKQGFLWIGTSNGLNRYDGYSIIIYRNDPNDSTSLANNAITALYEDESGILWVGTQNGLHRFDRITGRFTAYRNNPDNSNSLSSNLVRSIIEAPRGILWVSTKRGLNRLDVARGEWTLFKADKKGRGKGPSDNDIMTILADPTNRAHLWLGTRDGGLNKLHLPTTTFSVFKPDAFPTADEISIGITAMSFDPKGHLWLGTRDNMLWRFIPETGEFTPIEPLVAIAEQSMSQGNRTTTIQTLAIDKHGTLWAGTRMGIFSRSTLEDETGTWQQYTSNPNDAQSLSDDNVSVIRQDKSGVMWFGTQGGGLNKYVPQTSAFRNVKYNPLRKDIPSPIVNAIARKMSGEAWIGTQSGAVVYTGNSPSRLIASEYAVTAILHDSQGGTWLGTESGLIWIPRNGAEIRFQNSPDDNNSLGDNLVTALAEEKSSGDIWIGTQGGGISRLNPRTKTFTNYWSDAGISGSISDNFVFSMLVSQDGTLWVGTSNGLNRYNPQTNTFTAYLRTPQNGLPDAPILTLYEDAGGNLWLGTLGGGLYRFNPRSVSSLRFSKKDRLPSETIYGILGDKSGKLWLSTSRGLASLMFLQGNTSTPIVRTYGSADGLQSSAFRKGAYFRAADGVMSFGVGTGFVSFHPDSLRDNPTAPPVVLVRFRVFGDRKIIDTIPPPTQTRFELEYNDNFELEYAALDFTNSARNEYAYRIDEVHKDWLYTGENRRITGTNYDPGTYTLHIKAANSDGVWNNEGVTVSIIIHPPWWATWWFHSLIVVVGIGFIVLAYRLRVRRMIVLNSRLQTLVEERTKEISEQKYLLEEQAAEIQMTNGALQEKNVELENVLSVSEKERQELERAYKLLDIENNRKSQELNDARAFQISMLPARVPQIQGLDIAFVLRTATEVGGDYYDYVQDPEGGLTLAIGDATGHGVRAGMLVSLVKSSFHALVHDYTLSETVGMISQAIKQMRLQRMFMCLSLLHFRRKQNDCAWQIDMAGAGMPPLMVFRAKDHRVEYIRSQGIVLGAMESAGYPLTTFDVQAGDTILLMSDGILELFNASGDELGTQRLEDCFVRLCKQQKPITSEAMLDELHLLTDNWTDGEPLHDDIALIVVNVKA